jgi:hypothetical protein
MEPLKLTGIMSIMYGNCQRGPTRSSSDGHRNGYGRVGIAGGRNQLGNNYYHNHYRVSRIQPVSSFTLHILFRARFKNNSHTDLWTDVNGPVQDSIVYGALWRLT